MWLVVAAPVPRRGSNRKDHRGLQRLKADARAHQTLNPGTSYQEALRAVSSAGSPPTAADPILVPPIPPVLTKLGSGDDHIPTFYEFLGIGDIATHDFEAVWARNAVTDSLSVPYAYRVDGDELTDEIDFLDIIEANRSGHGPHGALAGRTGSGKSHLIRSLVLAMAATYGPDKVNFVLADFKGKWTFHGLDRIPHTAVSASALYRNTDRVEELMTALTDEVHRREEFISAVHACKDIFEYRAAQREHDGEDDWPTLPHLLVILDEFGEAPAGHPAMVQTLALIGRVGRALGIHLLVGSQMIDPATLSELVEHLSYRFCLSVNSATVSSNMIGTDDAAALTAGKVNWKALRRYRGDEDPVLIAALNYAEMIRSPDGDGDVTMADALIARLAATGQRPQMAMPPATPGDAGREFPAD